MVRSKMRYLLCEIVLPGSKRKALPFTERDIYLSVKDAIQMMHGDYGLGTLQAKLNVKYVNPYTRIVLIRAQRGCHQMLIQSLAMIQKIGKEEMLFRTLHVAGTIRSCQKFLIKYHREQLTVLLGECSTEEERNQVQESISRCSLETQSRAGGNTKARYGADLKGSRGSSGSGSRRSLPKTSIVDLSEDDDDEDDD